MKKLLTSSLFTVALTLGLYVLCPAQSKTSDFSGAWALDKSKTSDLPPTLESYTMTVAQDEQHLTVETDVQGEIGMRGGSGSRGAGRRGDGGGFPGGGRSGGIRFPGGGMGGGMPKDRVMAMALRMAPPKATYRLDGSETTIRMEAREDVGQPGGDIVAKASWKSGGKILELQSTRQLKTPDGAERTITSRDRWELSNEGQTLIIKRAVETPMGTNEVKLVFIKQ
jgi:hypothetical protein